MHWEAGFRRGCILPTIGLLMVMSIVVRHRYVAADKRLRDGRSRQRRQDGQSGLRLEIYTQPTLLIRYCWREATARAERAPDEQSPAGRVVCRAQG